MAYYRVYHLNEVGSIRSFHEIDCLNDGEATSYARTVIDGKRIELWNLNRKIATFDEGGVEISPVENTTSPGTW